MDCIFCKIANKQMPSFILFEDNDIIAVLDIYPANPGHIIIFPKNHFSRLENVPDSIIGKMFVLAKYLSSLLITSLKAAGINLYLASGEHAGQRAPHIILHVIPRYEGDGLQFEWSRKQVDPQILQQIQTAIVSALSKNEIKIANIKRTHDSRIFHVEKKTDLKYPNKNSEKGSDKSSKKKDIDYRKMLIWFLRKI